MKNIFRQNVGGALSRSSMGTLMIMLFLILLSLMMMFPFVYSIMQSLKNSEEIFAFPPRLLVKRPTLNNYKSLLRLTSSLWVPFSRYIFNSLFVSVSGTLLYIVISSMAAYSLTYGRFKGRRFINNIIVKALLFTSPVTSVAQFLIIARLHMLNTYWALLLPVIAAPLGVFLMKQFLEQMVPPALIEASRIDGCTEMGILLRVIIPVVKPAVLTLLLFSFQMLWNNTGSSFIYDEAFKVLPTVMNELVAGGISRAGEGAAAIVLLMVPPILIFFLTQSQVIETMAASGIKE